MTIRGSSCWPAGMIVLALACFMSGPRAPLAVGQQPILPRPTLLALYPAGGAAGQTMEVRITENADLAEASRLVFSHPGITAKPVMTEPDRFFPEARPVPNRFQVSIAAETPPGVYQVRAIDGGAASNARRFVVGKLPETLEEEDNNSIEKANPVATESTVNGLFATDYDYFRFSASKGQRLIIDCWAERIDSRCDAVLMLLDAKGREIASNQDSLGTDPMIDFTAAGDGDYFVRVNDLLFTSSGGANAAPYRMTISSGPWIDFVDPPLAVRDRERQFSLFGRNLGGAPSDVKLDGQTLEKLTVTLRPTADAAQASLPRDVVLAPFEATSDFFTYRHQTAAGVSNPVRIALSDVDAMAEVEPNDKPDQAQQVSTPAAILGRFDRAGDLDGYVFEAKKDEKLWIEVCSQRFGQATDPLLVVQQLSRDQEGVITARDLNVSDDAPAPGNFRITFNSTDPAWLLAAPADGEYRVLVRDQFNVSGERPSFYQLRIRPPRPDFRVLAVPGLELSANTNNNAQLQPRACVVRRGGSAEILLTVYRTEGFDGEIEVRADSLPPGVTASPTVIGPGNELGSMLVSANSDAKAWLGSLRLTALAKIDGREVARNAPGVELLWNSVANDPTPARLTESIYLSIDEGMQLPARLEAPQTQLRAARGGKLEVPLKLIKQTDDLKGNVTVSMVGLPQRINQNSPNVAPDGEGKLTLDLQQDVVPGRYTIFLRGDADIQQFRYRPELGERAKQDRDRIAKVQQELEKEYQKSVQARGQAERDHQQSVQQQNAAAGERQRLAQLAQQTQQQAQALATQAQQAQRTHEEALKRKADAVAQVQAANDEAGKNAAQQQLQQAEQQVGPAKTKLEAANEMARQGKEKAKQAAVEAAEAEKKHQAAIEKTKQAEIAKQKAMEAENQARLDRELGNRRKQEADQALQQATNLSRQRAIKAPIHSPTLTLEIAPYPCEFKLNSQRVTLAAGEEAELSATLVREFDFKDEVAISLQPPAGVSGWQLSPDAKIARDKNDAKFQLRIDKNAKPGDYQAELVLRMRFNNRSLEQRLPLEVTVAPTPR